MTGITGNLPRSPLIFIDISRSRVIARQIAHL
jgi:hypothetical protein